MGFRERLRKLDYTTPSGELFRNLMFEELARSGGKKFSAVEYPLQDTPDVTDLGEKGVTIPLVIYFYGDEYDYSIDAFWRGLAEEGVGTLRHPRFKKLTVLPVSRTQKESFVDNARVGVMEVEFLVVKTPSLFSVFSTPSFVSQLTNVARAVTVSLNRLENAMLDLQEDMLSGTGILALTQSMNALGESAASLEGAFAGVLSQKPPVITSDFRRGVSRLTSLPPSRLSQSPTLIAAALLVLGQQAPAGGELVFPSDTADFSLVSLSEGFTASLDSLALNLPGLPLKSSELSEISTEEGALSALYYKLSILVGFGQIIDGGSIVSRTEATQLIDTVNYWASSLVADIETIESVFSPTKIPVQLVQSLQEIQKTYLGYLYFVGNLSALQSTVVLPKDTNLIEFCYSVYRNLDRLEELERLNNLQDTEYFLLPRGRELTYLGGT
jgi:hypothetical protein